MNTRLLAKASFIALAAAVGAPQMAMAQSAVDALRDEILVRGTKKAEAENVQDVPLAVTAYGAAQLDALKVRDLHDLSYSMPNVQLEDVGTARGVANFSIRGLATNSSIPSIDPAVATFFDGVYLGQNAGAVLDIFDLESIEVFRGPQGILFGRNVTGGAVLINTKRPNLEQFEASFKTAVESGFRGTGNNYYLMGGMGGPLIQDVLGFRISAYYNNDRGWHKNYLGGPNLAAHINALGPAVAGAAWFRQNGIFHPAANPTGLAYPIASVHPDEFANHGKTETWMIRPQLLWRLGDSAEILVRYEHGSVTGDGPSSQNHPGLANLLPPVASTNVFFSVPQDSFGLSIDYIGLYDSSWDAVSAEINIDVGETGRITNIFGWRKSSGLTQSDIDGTPFWLFHADSDNDFEQISNEIRYAGRFWDRMDATIGFYYFDDTKTYQETRYLLGGSLNLTGGGTQDSRNYGVFGQFDFDITDRFTFIFGGRWTNEKKSAELFNLTLNSFTTTPCSVAARTCVIVPSAHPLYGLIYLNDSQTWKNFTPKVGFNWAVTDDTNLYGHWTQGVRSGGYNFRNTSALFPMSHFDEETVNSFEVGFKARPGNGKAVINAAFYYQEISDMQREINLPDAIAGVVQFIRNTADAHIFGFELESQIFLTDNLVFLGHLGHANGNYSSVLFDLNDDGVVNELDRQLQIPRLAPWSYGVGFIHNLDLGANNGLTTRFSYNHRDANAYTDNNLGLLKEADLIDASIALNLGGTATLSLYGKNLLNDATHGNETQLPATLGFGTFAPLNKGRVIGLELQLNL